MKLIDPVAQSFYVDKTSGIFVTSIDLFFFSKDTEVPVTVQLRSMKLGVPSEVIYPYSEVTLDSFRVNVSSDASIPTRFTFNSPVYLSGEQFHAIVITSVSDSYSVYISRLGEQNFVPVGSGQTTGDVIVTKQPLSGSLFKSQNAVTWTSSDFEDLKFKLYRANFNSSGNINFYNPSLEIGNSQVANLLQDSLKTFSNKIRIGIGTTVQDSGLTLGNTVIQDNSTGRGNYIGAAGSATGTLGLINAGIGYTPSSGSFTFNNVSLTSVTGTGRNATANITVTDGKVVSLGATISNGGTGYLVGDVLTASQIGSSSLGRNLRLSVSNISGINELILDNVEGEFITGSGNVIRYISNSGITTLNSTVGGNVTILSGGIQTESDGLHIKVSHKNHGMHSSTNSAKITGAISDISPTTTKVGYGLSSTSNLAIEDESGFYTFEGVGVAITNPGYALIGNEIISYTGINSSISPPLLTGITRNIDQTTSFEYPSGSLIYKYELSGVSLRRINTTHRFSDVTISNPIGLDFYHVKIDRSSAGKTDPLPYGQVDRSVETVGFPKLTFNQTKSTGGTEIYATQNIQFEILNPIVTSITPKGTNINASVRTVTGTSVNGSDPSFQDSGFESISLESDNYFESPRLICSKVNENNNLTSLPGKKSLTLALNLSSSNSYLSPAINLERVGLTLISNRVDSPISDYISDGRVSSLTEDPSSFVYATEPIGLESPATSIKVYITAHVNLYNDLRCMYAILNDPNDEMVYSLFPGYQNLTSSGQIIDSSQNSGLADSKYEKTSTIGFSADQIPYREYEYTINNLSSFKYYGIKFIGTSTNQAYPPRLKNLRVVVLE
jgi:hypothetical protein